MRSRQKYFKRIGNLRHDMSPVGQCPFPPGAAITARQATALWGVKTDTVLKWSQRGKLTCSGEQYETGEKYFPANDVWALVVKSRKRKKPESEK